MEGRRCSSVWLSFPGDVHGDALVTQFPPSGLNKISIQRLVGHLSALSRAIFPFTHFEADLFENSDTCWLTQAKARRRFFCFIPSNIHSAPSWTVVILNCIISLHKHTRLHCHPQFPVNSVQDGLSGSIYFHPFFFPFDCTNVQMKQYLVPVATQLNPLPPQTKPYSSLYTMHNIVQRDQALWRSLEAFERRGTSHSEVGRLNINSHRGVTHAGERRGERDDRFLFAGFVPAAGGETGRRATSRGRGGCREGGVGGVWGDISDAQQV